MLTTLVRLCFHEPSLARVQSETGPHAPAWHHGSSPEAARTIHVDAWLGMSALVSHPQQLGTHNVSAIFNTMNSKRND
jgi:hypothetical protein